MGFARDLKKKKEKKGKEGAEADGEDEDEDQEKGRKKGGEDGKWGKRVGGLPRLMAYQADKVQRNL